MTRSRHRRCLLAVAAIAFLGTALQTGAFSAATVERPLQVDVGADEKAALGVESDLVVASERNASEEELLRITNRFGTDVTVEVVVGPEASAPPRIRRVDSPLSIGPGESETVTATVDCSDAAPGAAANPTEAAPRSADLDVRIDARGDGIAVELSRTVTVECGADSAPSRGPR